MKVIVSPEMEGFEMVKGLILDCFGQNGFEGVTGKHHSEDWATKPQMGHLHALESQELPGGWDHPVWQVGKCPFLTGRLQTLITSAPPSGCELWATEGCWSLMSHLLNFLNTQQIVWCPY